MANCIVLKNYLGWKKGDHIEAFGSRLQELLDGGIVNQVKETVPNISLSHEKCYIRGPKGGFIKYPERAENVSQN